MNKMRRLLALTGYIHGGCYPIDMKKSFKTVLHDSACNLDTITFSAGKIGCQVEVEVEELSKVMKYSLADVCIQV